MKFCSTRGGVKGLSFQEALLCPGYASDGGLVVPEAIPRLSVDDIRSFAGLTYPEVVEKLLGYFVSVDELSPTEIHGKSPWRRPALARHSRSFLQVYLMAASSGSDALKLPL